tara:strand:+ start:920 stop:1045 length:126 start_codon:yes stop_codon:yes gene_type:complete
MVNILIGIFVLFVLPILCFFAFIGIWDFMKKIKKWKQSQKK